MTKIKAARVTWSKDNRNFVAAVANANAPFNKYSFEGKRVYLFEMRMFADMQLQIKKCSIFSNTPFGEPRRRIFFEYTFVRNL